MKDVPHASSFKKILVTGGAGFIGQHLLNALVTSGHQPTALTRSVSKVENLTPDLKERVRWRELDLLNQEAVRAFVKAERPSVIFHLAGTRGKGTFEVAQTICHRLNVEATATMLESSKEAGVERVVLVGSAEEYGRQAGQLKESLPLTPVSAYGISKAAATRLAREMFEVENFPVVIVRPFTVYGPAQPSYMFVAAAIESAVSGKPFRMTEGVQRRDLVYVDDAVRALLLAASVPQLEGRGINIGSGRAETLLEIARLIWKLSESRAPLLVGERVATPDETHNTWADITLARELLNWEPRVSLEDGLRATIEWARGQQERAAKRS